MIDKNIVKIACQECINSYEGKHGKVKKVLEKVQSYSFGHTEFRIGKYKDYIIVTFQGSNGKADWFDNLKFNKIHLNDDIKVHFGFYWQFDNIQYSLYNELYKLDFNKIIFAGHSLGGALATLASTFYKNRHRDINVSCITFGSPRVGNKKFIKYFNKNIDESERYVNGEDSVTKLPMSWRTLFFNYKHVRTKIKIDQKLSWKEKILLPIRKIFGNPLDHEPERYLKNI